MLEADSLMEGNTYDVRSKDVLHLVNTSTCSAYDCEFVALAKFLDVSLVTMDKKVLKSFPNICVSLKSSHTAKLKINKIIQSKPNPHGIVPPKSNHIEQFNYLIKPEGHGAASWVDTSVCLRKV